MRIINKSRKHFRRTHKGADDDRHAKDTSAGLN